MITIQNIKLPINCSKQDVISFCEKALQIAISIKIAAIVTPRNRAIIFIVTLRMEDLRAIVIIKPS